MTSVSIEVVPVHFRYSQRKITLLSTDKLKDKVLPAALKCLGIHCRLLSEIMPGRKFAIYIAASGS